MNTVLLPKESKKEGLVESDISSIIDAQIQFLESSSSQIFHTTELSKTKDEINLEHDYVSMMTQVKRLTRRIRYLHVLRSWLAPRNLRMVFKLLMTNSYLNYSEDELTHLLCYSA